MSTVSNVSRAPLSGAPVGNRGGMRSKSCLAAIIALLASTPACAQTSIKYSSLGGATDAGVYLADAYGYFREHGITVSQIVQSSIPSQVAEAATGAVEVSGIALAPGLFASVQRNINLRLVGDKQSLRPGYSSTRLVARPEFVKATEAETMRGLKGRKIGGPGRTSIGYYLVHELFKKHGMSLGDFDYVEVQLPNQAAALAAKAIDGALSIDPFLSRAVQTGLANVVSDLIEFVPEGGKIGRAHV